MTISAIVKPPAKITVIVGEGDQIKSVVKMGGISNFRQEVLERVNGTNDFATTAYPIEDSLIIFIDGIYHNKTFYTIINRNIIRFNFNVGPFSIVSAMYQF